MATNQSNSWESLLVSSGHDSGEQSELVRRGLLGSTADCVKVLGVDGKLLYLNPGGQTILEVQEDPVQVVGLDWLSLWSGEDRLAAQAAIAQATQGGVGRFQGFCPTFTGKPRWWDVVISPMTNAAGCVEQLLSVSRDITQLKLTQLSQARERHILEQFAAGQPPDQILESIAAMIGEECPGIQAAILLWEPDEDRAFAGSRLLAGLSLPLKANQLTNDMANLDAEHWEPVRRRFAEQDLHCCDMAVLGNGSGGPSGLVILACRNGVAVEINPLARASWLGLARLALKHIRHHESLTESRARFAALTKVSPVGVFQADRTGGRTFVNDRWTAITGLPAAEAMGMGWVNTIHPDDRESVLRSWLEAVAAGADFRAEYRLLDKKGKVTWVIGEATAAGDDGFIGTITDITDLKLAHDALLESSARFELLANNMSQLCWMADGSGWTFWYNRRWFDYTGTTLDQMQGWGWRTVHHPDFIDGVVERFAKSLETCEDWEDTFPLRSKTGEYRWFLSRAKPIRDASGKVIRWFGTNTDVTEHRELEKSLALQNIALRRSNQELTQFAYVASHDLQEPLRTISNYAQLLERRHGESFNEEVRKSFNIIVDSAQRMSKLITDLLLYSRISSEPLESDQDLELATAVQDAKVMLAGPFRELGAELEVCKLPCVRGNRSRLSQLFLNLIGNSLKYRQPGRAPRISIDSRAEGAFWRIAVSDNGQGFAPEYSDRIFGIFKRLHGREIPGTGIGLALCRSIVERMGGTIGAEGRPGEGATFWFTVPR